MKPTSAPEFTEAQIAMGKEALEFCDLVIEIAARGTTAPSVAIVGLISALATLAAATMNDREERDEVKARLVAEVGECFDRRAATRF